MLDADHHEKTALMGAEASTNASAPTAPRYLTDIETFCARNGITSCMGQKMPSIELEYSTAGNYSFARQQRDDAHFQYLLSNFITATLLVLQIIVACCITALSAYGKFQVTVTVLGAVNVAFAASLGLMKGPKWTEIEWKKMNNYQDMVDAIEDGVRELLFPSSGGENSPKKRQPDEMIVFTATEISGTEHDSHSSSSGAMHDRLTSNDEHRITSNEPQGDVNSQQTSPARKPARMVSPENTLEVKKQPQKGKQVIESPGHSAPGEDHSVLKEVLSKVDAAAKKSRDDRRIILPQSIRPKALQFLGGKGHNVGIGKQVL